MRPERDLVEAAGACRAVLAWPVIARSPPKLGPASFTREPDHHCFKIAHQEQRVADKIMTREASSPRALSCLPMRGVKLPQDTER